MQYTLLDKINSPQDLKCLSNVQLGVLAREIRHFLVNSVAKTGGHLASNLGTVELTLAMHKVFSSPDDKLIFDVGHQCYTHKILTGRKEKFLTLRKKGGISGFPKTHESEHDAFIAGHSSTSISAALGIAEAFLLKNQQNHAVAVIGDGSFTGGQAYEALNNAGRSKSRLVVILNHNDMSISKNVGGLARYLTTIRARHGYIMLKEGVENVLDHTPLFGKPVKRILISSKSVVKSIIYRSTFFEELGFSYLGPVDGHNIEELNRILQRAKDIGAPVVIQVETVKGKGYHFAEENPGAYHSTTAFNPSVGDISVPSTNNYSDNFGRYLNNLAGEDERICAITAAMKYGTGLNYFYQAHKERFFDVGIAEAHAVTFAGGLASQGFIPVFAVYSSFLQRGFDQVLHDLSIDKQHVVLAIDRAGLVGEDGETHQGIFDAAFLSQIPLMTLYSPEGYDEANLCLKKAIDGSGVVGVRYPRGASSKTHSLGISSEFVFQDNSADTLIISYGRVFSNCYDASLIMKKHEVSLLKLTKICPISSEILRIVMGFKRVLFVEEGIKNGGIGQQLGSMLLENGFDGRYKVHAIEGFVMQSSVTEALIGAGLDASSIAKMIAEMPFK